MIDVARNEQPCLQGAVRPRRGAADPVPRSAPHGGDAATRPGVHPKIVSEMLGHSTIAITLDTDSHVTPTMQREAAAAMNAVLAR